MERDRSIDTLRGLAIVIIVVFHSTIQHYTSQNVTATVYFLVYRLGLPVFAAISGLVYAPRPVRPGNMVRFLKRKAERILLPGVTVSTLSYLLRVYMPGINNPLKLADIWRIYVFRFDQFWFLYALALVFVIVAAIDYFRLMEKFAGWLTFWLIAVVSTLIFDMNMLSCSGALYLMPYFLLGYGIARFPAYFGSLKLCWPALFLFVTGFLLLPLAWFGRLPRDICEPLNGVGLVIGVSAIVSLIKWRATIPVISHLGRYSYSIYLFHLIGGALSVRVIQLLSSAPPLWIRFVFHFMFGLTLPIVLEKVIMRSRYLGYLFLGMAINKRTAAPVQAQNAG